jgi:lipid-binding SYLF domain-containing protein
MVKAGRLLPAALLGLCLLGAASAARADTQPEALVLKARISFENLINDKDYPQLRHYLKQGKGVMIMPSQLKGAFILGAEGGSGVLLAKDMNGNWGYPAFYTVGAGSIGLQAGFQDSEAVLVIMTERALNAILNNQVKLGADVSVAVGPVGRGLEGATTTNVGGDIVAFSHTSGLFAGGSLDGAAIVKRNDWNSQFYGPGATPRAIIYENKFSNPKADPLREALQSAVQ